MDPSSHDDSYSSYSASASGSFVSVDPMVQFSLAPSTEADVQLEVSGNSFVMNPLEFQKLARLPWQRIHASAYRLDASFSPDSFEKCLEYVQMGTLPKCKRMKADEKQELAAMAQALGLGELADHMAGKKGKKKGFFRSKK